MVDVSIITAAYNTEKYLHRCIQSVLSQREIDLELIVVDDGSTDNTLAICRQYEAATPRLKTLTIPNGGQGPARNRGMDVATGRYLYFLDSDDYLSHDDCLALLTHAADKHSLDICSPGTPRHYFTKPHEFISAIPTRMQFVSRKLIETYGIRQPDVRSGQDGVFGHLMLCHSKRFGVCEKAKIFYRVDRPGSTFQKHRKRPDLVAQLVRGHLSAIDEHYETHGLWESEVTRFLSFLHTETLTNRLAPHWAYLDQVTREEIAELVSGYAAKAVEFLPRKFRASVHPAISALNNRSKEEIASHLLDTYIDRNIAEPLPGYDDLFYKDERVHVRKRAPQPTSVFRDYLKQLDRKSQSDGKRLDFLINLSVNSEANNRTVFDQPPAFIGCAAQKHGDELVVSMTTIPNRLNTVHLPIEAIFAQDYRPDRIVLWMGDHFDFDLSAYPRLERATNNGLEIRRVRDVGPHTKLVYALREFSKADVVTFDDDMLYPTNTLSTLMRLAKQFSGCVIGNWARSLTLDKNHKVQPVRKGRLLTPPHLEFTSEQEAEFKPVPSLKGFAYGTGGVLYPAKSLHEQVDDFDLMQELCPTEDDVWFKAMSLKKGTPVVPTNLGFSPPHFCVTSSQVTALRHVNHDLGGNVGQIRNVFDFFDLESLMSDQAEALVLRKFGLN